MLTGLDASEQVDGSKNVALAQTDNEEYEIQTRKLSLWIRQPRRAGAIIFLYSNFVQRLPNEGNRVVPGAYMKKLLSSPNLRYKNGVHQKKY